MADFERKLEEIRMKDLWKAIGGAGYNKAQKPACYY